MESIHLRELTYKRKKWDKDVGMLLFMNERYINLIKIAVTKYPILDLFSAVQKLEIWDVSHNEWKLFRDLKRHEVFNWLKMLTFDEFVKINGMLEEFRELNKQELEALNPVVIKRVGAGRPKKIKKEK